MTLWLTDEKTATPRQQAEVEHRSMQELARAAVREYVERRQHEALIPAATARVVTEDADILRELTDR
jgi:hypothetical protein